jgi:hypothetical protein
MSSDQMEHRNRHVKRWPIIIADLLYYKNNDAYLVMEETNIKFVTTMCQILTNKTCAS